jgi:hypothetical protein
MSHKSQVLSVAHSTTDYLYIDPNDGSNIHIETKLTATVSSGTVDYTVCDPANYESEAAWAAAAVWTNLIANVSSNSSAALVGKPIFGLRVVVAGSGSGAVALRVLQSDK